MRKFNIITATILSITIITLGNFSNSLAMEGNLDKQLITAASMGDVERIEKLLADGADINACIDTQTPLSGAVFNGHLGAVKTLLARNALVNTLAFGHNNLLTLASTQEDPEILTALIAANPYMSTATLTSPLCNSIGFQQINNIKVLLDAGAEPLLRPDGHWSPLELAIHDSWIDGIKLLLTKVTPAQLNQNNLHKWSPMEKVVRTGNIAIVVLLLAAGANPLPQRTVIIDGQAVRGTALDFAKQLKNSCMISLLENFLVTPGEVNNINTGILSLNQAAPQTFNKDMRGIIKFLLIQNVIEEKMEKIKSALPDKVWDKIDKDGLQKALAINIRRALNTDATQRLPTKTPAITP